MNTIKGLIVESSSTKRLMFALLMSTIAYFITPSESGAARFMIVWIAFAASVSGWFWIIFILSDLTMIVQIARKQDANRIIIFLFGLLSASVSVVAIIFMLKQLPDPRNKGYYSHLILSILSVVFSWILIHTTFAFHYAHVFYKSYPKKFLWVASKSIGLEFPGKEEPDYLDFAYFSFVIGMTFQVSDVQITTKKIRRQALFHGILSFLFNTTFVALLINIISNIIQK